jgi:hypothetical protein
MKKPRENPELLLLTNPPPEDVERALRAYERFHWNPPAEVHEVELPEGINAPSLIRIGEVDEIRYSTGKDSQRSKIAKAWSHIFKVHPHLCTTPKGDVLIIFGGKLSVTPRGIEG